MSSHQKKERNAIDLLNKIPGLNYGEKDKDKHLDALTLLSLPNHLRKTSLALIKIKIGDAEKVSSVSGQSLSQEKKNLEELTSMGFLKRQKKDLKIYYVVK